MKAENHGFRDTKAVTYSGSLQDSCASSVSKSAEETAVAFFSRFLCVALIGPTELSINVGRRPLGQIEKDAKYR